MNSVEYLINHLTEYGFKLEEHKVEITQAKEMHRKEVTTAFIDGEFNIDSDGCQVDRYGVYNYYEETFKNIND